MDYAVIDTEYQKLQSEANSVGDKIQNLAAKLQKLQSSGNQDAREWLLDLKDIAISVQSEQNQMFSFLQTLHQNIPQVNDQCFTQPAQNQGYANQQTQQYQQQPQQKKGFFSSLLGSGFGQAIEMGAGFGIGDDLINSIF
jgi:ribosomal silencing factor RsfS